MIKAIETRYNGYRFRSRLEARWAVLFDKAGIKYEYEKEGYDLGGIWYLPDFWLPEQGYFVEIKGQEPTEEEREKAKRLVYHSRKPVVFCWGQIPLTDSACWVEVYQLDNHGMVESNGDCFWVECPACHKLSVVNCCHLEEIPCGCLSSIHRTSRLLEAYAVAREARFEH